MNTAQINKSMYKIDYIIKQKKRNSTKVYMNKKTLDALVQKDNFNQTLFKQSISIVQCTKNIVPVSKIPVELMKQKQATQLKKKQQQMQTQLSKAIKLFGQILGVSKNSFGTVSDYATQIYQELTDLIQTSCQSYLDKKKNIKSLQKQKEQSLPNQIVGLKSGLTSNRPQDKYPSIKPALFDHHLQKLSSLQSIRVKCQKIQHSSSINQPYVYVATKDSLSKMVQQLSACRQIAVDLEHSNKSYEGFTCLIQISSRYKDYIVDVFPIWEHVHQLKALIQNQKIIKVMHGAEMDSKWLQRDFNIHIINLFDTYKASRVLGYPKFSYAYLLNHYCDTITDKKYQLADWRQRPLSQEMLHYARMDTHYLLQIWDKLLQDLTKQATLMHIDPQVAIQQIYRSSYDVTLSQIELFSYKKKQIYQNIKNDTKTEDFQIIERVFWTIDKIARQQDESFDQLINKRTLTDVIGRVKDLIQNKRATIDMLRVKIDRLIGVIKGHKHQRVGLLLAPLKKELETYFLDPKKQVQVSGKKKIKANISNQPPLIQSIQRQKIPSSKQNIQQNAFELKKPSILIQQIDYPLKTYENFSLQQRLNNKKCAFSLIQFEPIMSFLSQKFNISQKKQCEIEQENKRNDLQQYSQEMQIQGDVKQEGNQNDKQVQQNEGFLQFKRIKPNVMYTIEQEQEQDKQNKIEKKPKKKRKQLEYQTKLKNKQGNIYELLEDV